MNSVLSICKLRTRKYRVVTDKLCIFLQCFWKLNTIHWMKKPSLTRPFYCYFAVVVMNARPPQETRQTNKEKRQTIHLTQTYPEVFINEVWVQVINYVGVFVFLHDQNLINNKLLLWLLREVHLLDGDLHACGCLNGSVHRPWGSAENT